MQISAGVDCGNRDVGIDSRLCSDCIIAVCISCGGEAVTPSADRNGGSGDRIACVIDDFSREGSEFHHKRNCFKCYYLAVTYNHVFQRLAIVSCLGERNSVDRRSDVPDCETAIRICSDVVAPATILGGYRDKDSVR